MTRSHVVNADVAKNVDGEVFVEEGPFGNDVTVDADPVVTQDGAVLLLEEGVEAVELFLLQIHHKDDGTGGEKRVAIPPVPARRHDRHHNRTNHAACSDQRDVKPRLIEGLHSLKQRSQVYLRLWERRLPSDSSDRDTARFHLPSDHVLSSLGRTDSCR